MAGFQFAHVECYARRASKKQPNSRKDGKEQKRRERKLNAREVAAEAERQPGAHPHVPQAKPPEIVFGMMPSKVVELAEKNAEASIDSKGRKVRADTPILLAGVASHPFTPSDLADSDKEAEFREWIQLAVDFLKSKYSGDLQSVVLHTDERHLHIHFYAVPKPGPGFNAKKLHDGFRAGEAAKNPKEQKLLYTEAMRAFQDQFFEQVSAKVGHVRIGPRKRRLSRAAWLAEQHQADALKKLFAKAQKGLRDAERQAKQLIEEAKAKAEATGMKFGAFLSGLTGNAKAAIEKLTRERDEARRKAKAEAEEAQKLQAALARERLRSREQLDRLVALKIKRIEAKLEKAKAEGEELKAQLEAASRENATLRSKLAGIFQRKVTSE